MKDIRLRVRCWQAVKTPQKLWTHVEIPHCVLKTHQNGHKSVPIFAGLVQFFLLVIVWLSCLSECLHTPDSGIFKTSSHHLFYKEGCPLPWEILSSELVHQSKTVDLLLLQFDHVILLFFFFLYHFLLPPQGRFLSFSGPGQNSFWHVCFKDIWQSVRKHWWARDRWPAIKVKSVGVELGTSRLHVSLTGLSQCLEG